MATFTFEIPDAIVSRVMDAFGASYGYAATLPDGSSNPETLAQFTKRKVISYMREVTIAHERQKAGAAAEKASEDKAKAEIAIR